MGNGIDQTTDNLPQHLPPMVYINSQSALEEMSQFSFLSQEKERYTRNEQQRILGVRIIKPDGTIQETDPQEYMETDEGGHPRSRNIQEKWNKLAVPGLEIGDIIDLFFVRYTILNNQNPEPFGFYFMDSYPLLAYSVHCEIDPKLSTFYRCLNGARDFDHSTDTEGNHILDLHTGDSGRVIPDFWYNSARQTPMILMYIYNSKTPYAWMPPSARKPGLYANPNPKLMTDDTRASMKAPGTNWSGLRSGRKGEISKALKARQAEGWSDKKLMDYLYQYCYYRYMENGADYTPASFILLMHELLEKQVFPTGQESRPKILGSLWTSSSTTAIPLGLSIWNPTENAILHRPAMLFPVKCLPACKAKKPYWKTTHALPFPPPPPKTTGIWLP